MTTLLNALGVPCWTVENSYHSWNKVLMDDDKWYATDVTWNDDGSAPNYKFMNQSDEAIKFRDGSSNTHKLSENYPAPKCESTYYPPGATVVIDGGKIVFIMGGGSDDPVDDDPVDDDKKEQDAASRDLPPCLRLFLPDLLSDQDRHAHGQGTDQAGNGHHDLGARGHCGHMGRLQGAFRIPSHDHQIHGSVHGLEKKCKEHRSHKPQQGKNDGPFRKIILFPYSFRFHFFFPPVIPQCLLPFGFLMPVPPMTCSAFVHYFTRSLRENQAEQKEKNRKKSKEQRKMRRPSRDLLIFHAGQYNH